jgi:hypothetical protein
MFISTNDLGYYGTVVQTDHKSIQDLLAVSKEEAAKYVITTKESLTNLELDTLYQNKEKWQSFCNDVVIYFTFRYKIDDTPIPLIPACFARNVCRPICLLCANESAKFKCSVCGVRYCSKKCQIDDWLTHKPECMVPDLQPIISTESERPILSPELPPGVDLNECL